MTPQERQLVDDLFDRLARLETSPREPDADAAIAQGLRRAPNAVYALVQTVLVQDEALKRADARIQELEGTAQQQQPSGGFLDSMREAVLGPGQSRGSVPNIRPGDSTQRGPVWNSGQALGQADARMGGDPRMNDPRPNDPRSGNPGGGLFGGGNAGGGGSFLGTAAATAAGVIGGSMLMNSIRGMMGGGSSQQQSLGNTAESGGSKMPSDNSQSSGNLARDAGVNDVGKSGSGDGQRQSSYDQAQADTDQDQDQDQDDGDFDDFDDGDSDFA
ncbi:MAG: DUF2076 domain-containing protein [Afipia sp.]|nr:DUF2076 domain-containing protein [Afipia sp.]